MKNILSLLLPFILVSCNLDAGSLKSASPNVANSVELSATKTISEPMEVTVKYLSKGEATSQKVQIYASEINDENVEILWATEVDCNISFVEQDGTKKGLLISNTNGVIGFQSYLIEE